MANDPEDQDGIRPAAPTGVRAALRPAGEVTHTRIRAPVREVTHTGIRAPVREVTNLGVNVGTPPPPRAATDPGARAPMSGEDRPLPPRRPATRGGLAVVSAAEVSGSFPRPGAPGLSTISAQVPAVAAVAVSDEVAAALAGLKKVGTTTTKAVTPAQPRKPAAQGVDVTPIGGAVEPPRPLSGRGLFVAVAVVVVAVVAGTGVWLTRPTVVANLPVPTLPDDAARCLSLASRGSDLVCLATSTSLHGLLPRERDARLQRTLAVARGAGFTRVLFEDEGRVWRTEVLTVPAPSSSAPSSSAPTSSASSSSAPPR